MYSLICLLTNSTSTGNVFFPLHNKEYKHIKGTMENPRDVDQ